MHGSPPRIALMNNIEDTSGSGNAAILASYLRLAGICTDVYDIVTPNEIRDGILTTGGFDFLWAPHWTGYDNYEADNNGNGTPDVEDIVIKIKEFIQNGNGLLAECASIEVLEHSLNGLFLTTKGFGHNDGTNDPNTIIYNDVTSPNAQAGDFPFMPEGGHLHNWRPFVAGDTYKLDPAPDVSGGNSEYRDTVKRFTIDNTGWDYYVGGYAYGDTNNGYVVYLGGHKFAKCGGVDAEPNAHTFEFEFEKDLDKADKVYTVIFDVRYSGGPTSSVTFNTNDDFSAIAKVGDPLEIDFTTASVDKKKLRDVKFTNNGANDIPINFIQLTWSGGGGDEGNQRIKKITDKKTDVVLYSGLDDTPFIVHITDNDLTIDAFVAEEEAGVGCTNNSDCEWNSIAGVRYVLNTLFNIKFQIVSHEYVRAAPVISYPHLYQGSFEYPSYEGHFRRFDVVSGSGDPDDADWNTADGHISVPGSRHIYTSKNVDGSWSKVEFKIVNMDQLRVPLDVTPGDGDDTDEEAVIERVRGKFWSSDTGWNERVNKLGGIMHSAPVIVTSNARTGSRTEIAYVGDLYGMLHAIEIENGDEKWAFIPQNLLGKLKNDRTDPNATQNFAAVDASPTAADIYYDHDNNSSTEKEWRTILACPEGKEGNYIFVLDVTDPDNWFVLWETTDSEAPGGGMGHSSRVAINKVKWPVSGGGGITGYETKWVVFVATGYLDIAEAHGGINVFAYDLKTGVKLWHFSSVYADSVNDIPGPVTLFDYDDDGFVDYAYVGDMNGRMWEIDAITGSNPNGTQSVDGVVKEIPLWNAGVGNPISVSPAIIRYNPVVVIFGTGGTDWAANDKNYYVYAINASDKQGAPTYAGGAGTLLWELQLDVGEKVWSSPTIAAGQIFVATSTGSMESSDPRNDIAGTGNLYSISLEPGGGGNAAVTWKIDDIGKVRGSLYVSRHHIFLSTIDNEIIQVGDEDFSEGNINNVILKSWRKF
jgi:tRNA threonylcarbamoyladenosine modification (KEOPS) complex  Pcc1 subunit